MKTLTLLAILATSAFGQTFHITKIQDHIRTQEEQSFSKAMHTRNYTGTIDGMTVVAEEAITAFSPASQLSVGGD